MEDEIIIYHIDIVKIKKENFNKIVNKNNYCKLRKNIFIEKSQTEILDKLKSEIQQFELDALKYEYRLKGKQEEQKRQNKKSFIKKLLNL